MLICNTFLPTFRYRYPREGTETIHNTVNDYTSYLDIDIPERGRKLPDLLCIGKSKLFRYRYPREGTETMISKNQK